MKAQDWIRHETPYMAQRRKLRELRAKQDDGVVLRSDPPPSKKKAKKKKAKK